MMLMTLFWMNVLHWKCNMKEQNFNPWQIQFHFKWSEEMVTKLLFVCNNINRYNLCHTQDGHFTPRTIPVIKCLFILMMISAGKTISSNKTPCFSTYFLFQILYTAYVKNDYLDYLWNNKIKIFLKNNQILIYKPLSIVSNENVLLLIWIQWLIKMRRRLLIKLAFLWIG